MILLVKEDLLLDTHLWLGDYRMKVADRLSNVIDSIVFAMLCIFVIVCECVIVPLFVLVKNVDCLATSRREGPGSEYRCV